MRNAILGLSVVAALAAGALGLQQVGEKAGCTGRRCTPDAGDDEDLPSEPAPTAKEKARSKPGRLRSGALVSITEVDLPDGGTAWRRIPHACVIPDCWGLEDGGWDDSAVVNCRGHGVYGHPDGGPMWRGCAALPAENAVGGRCVPVPCSVYYGDDPNEVLH